MDRLRAFLGEGGQLEIYAPNDPTRPGYALPFLRRVTAAAVGTAALLGAADSPAPTETQHSSPAAESRVLSDLQSMYARYGTHGRTDYRIELHGLAPHQPDVHGPHVIHEKREVDSHAATCAISELRAQRPAAGVTDHDPGVSDTALARAATLVHEDFHCRLHPYLRGTDHDVGASEPDGPTAVEHYMTDRYLTLVGESISDAGAVLMIAHKDGRDAALSVVTAGLAQRAQYQSSDIGLTHDTVRALELAKRMLDEPANYRDPETVFTRAIGAGLQGASDTFLARAVTSEMVAMQKPYFRERVTAMSRGLDRALDAYRHGRFPHQPTTVRTESLEVASDSGAESRAGATAGSFQAPAPLLSPAAQRIQDDLIRSARGAAQSAIMAEASDMSRRISGVLSMADAPSRRPAHKPH